MVSLSNLDFLLIFIYFVVLIVIGYISSRRMSAEGYLIGERKIGSFGTMATINASKTGSVLMLFVALVYLWGFAALWYFIGMVVGVLIFLPFALRLKRNSEKRFYTLADYFKYNYGEGAAILASLITIVLMFGFLILNLIAGTKIFVFFTSWPFWLCAIVMVLVVMVYLLLGGFKAVVKTDVIQYVLMIFILVVLVLTMFSGALIPASEWNFFRADIGTMVGFFIVGILFPFAMPDMWRRVYSAKNLKALKVGILSSAGIYAVFAFLLGLVALTIKARFPGVDPDFALIHGFGHLLFPGLLGLALVLLFAAIMSSVDTYIFTTASAIIQDFFKGSKKFMVRNIKKMIFVLAVLGTIASILLQNLVISAYIFASFILVLSAVVIATWINKRIKQRTLVYGIIFGFIGIAGILIYGLLLGKGIQPYMAIIALGLSVIGLIVGGVISIFKS